MNKTGNTYNTNNAIRPLAMDSLNYYYNKNTNQLNYVADAVPSGNYSNDIDNENKNNYAYNAIGELVTDTSAKIDTVLWTIYGKVHKIVTISPLDSTPGDSIVLLYDPLGNRREKRVYIHQLPLCDTCVAPFKSDTTKYVRDAQGNILAIYDRKNDTVRLTEFDLYGSKRIGTIDTAMVMKNSITGSGGGGGGLDSTRISYLEGQRQYELTNHLGNVLVTVDDRKLPVDTTSTPNIANYYVANVINAQDYYPFGMIEPGRQYTLTGDSSYRYLFNGKLHDDDIYGKDNSYDYGMRMYDPRIGRFMSIDPIVSKYPWLTPYQFASLNPIKYIDIDGKEGGVSDFLNNVQQTAHAIVETYNDLKTAAAVAAVVLYAASTVNNNTTAAQKQAAVLTTQFFLGYGPEHQYFGPNDPITQDIASSKLTQQARDDFYKQNKVALSKGDFQNVHPITGKLYEFEPFAGVPSLVGAPQLEGLIPFTGSSGPLTEGGNAQQFVGSAVYSIALGKDNKTLEFTVYNETSVKSLEYHAPFAKSHTRAENPVMGTISQTFTWTETLKPPPPDQTKK